MGRGDGVMGAVRARMLQLGNNLCFDLHGGGETVTRGAGKARRVREQASEARRSVGSAPHDGGLRSARVGQLRGGSWRCSRTCRGTRNSCWRVCSGKRARAVAVASCRVPGRRCCCCCTVAPASARAANEVRHQPVVEPEAPNSLQWHVQRPHRPRLGIAFTGAEVALHKCEAATTRIRRRWTCIPRDFPRMARTQCL